MGNSAAGPARVVITGVGLVTPLGLSTDENLERCFAGESAIGPIHGLEVEAHPCRAGAHVPEFDLSNVLRFPKNSRFMNHSVRCAMQAAGEATCRAGLQWDKLDPLRIALYTGSGQTGLESDDYFRALEAAWPGEREMDLKYLGGLPSHLIDRYIVLRTLANGGLGLLSTEFGIQGPNSNLVQSDTASAIALSCAYHDLVENRCDAALAGGHDSLLSSSNFLAYEKAGLLSASEPCDAYRPFDRQRDGLVLGEGSGFFVLERWDDAEARGAEIVGELCGVGCATDLDGGDEGAPGAEALRAAVAEAVDGSQIDFVVARGIGTKDGDSREACMIAAAVGSRVPVTALKSRTGYLGAATTAVELGVGLLCARQGSTPPILRHTAADPDCLLDLVVGEPRRLARRQPLGLFLSASWTGQIAAIAARAIEA
jgi:3-oxoacyl-[acyl-carrier-protein] synthase II